MAAYNPLHELLGLSDAGASLDLAQAMKVLAAPPVQPKSDIWDMLGAIGPRLMMAGGKPGANFLGAIGEAAVGGMDALQKQRREELEFDQTTRANALARAKLGVDIAGALRKEEKDPLVQEFFDEKTGQPYKAQLNRSTGQWDRVGGTKGTENGALPAGYMWNDPGDRSKGAMRIPGVAVDGKLPEGFRLVDQADPSKGIELIPGFAAGKGALSSATEKAKPPAGYLWLDEKDPSKGAQRIPGLPAEAGARAPEGFAWRNPGNPADGVIPLPGYREGKVDLTAAMEGVKGGKNAIVDKTDATGFKRKAIVDKNSGAHIAWVDDGYQPRDLPPGGILVAPDAPAAPAGPAPPSVRTNNPGAINISPINWQGMSPTQSGGRLVTFNTPEDGIRAMQKNLLAFRSKYGLDTVDGIIKRWAPKEENNTEVYIDRVSKALGVDRNAKLPMDDPEFMSRMMSAMARVEAGRDHGPYSQAEMLRVITGGPPVRDGRGTGIANMPAPPQTPAPQAAQQGPLGAASGDAPVLAPGIRELARGPKVAGNVETEEQKVVGKSLGDSFVRYQEGARSARIQMDKLRQAQQLSEGLATGGYTGNLLDLQRNLESLGIKTNLVGKSPEVARLEALRGLANEYALTLRDPSSGQGMPGQMSNFDVQFLQQAANMGLETTPEGRRLSMEFRKKLAQRNIELARMAEQWRGKNGTLMGFDVHAADWADKNPIFDQEFIGRIQKAVTGRAAPQSGRAAPPAANSLTVETPNADGTTRRQQVPVQEAPAVGADPQGNIPTFTSPDDPEFAKLPSGSVFRTPDGKLRFKP